MNVYVWLNAERITENYHDGGGVLAIAASVDDARALFERKEGRQPNGRTDASIFASDPDYTVGCDATDERLFIFPDAGCC